MATRPATPCPPGFLGGLGAGPTVAHPLMLRRLRVAGNLNLKLCLASSRNHAKLIYSLGGE